MMVQPDTLGMRQKYLLVSPSFWLVLGHIGIHAQLATPSERLLSSVAMNIFSSREKSYQAGLEVDAVH